MHAVTDASASGTLSGAALFADLNNGGATTVGNAIRAYTNNATSANLVSFYQESTAYSGTGLIMNFGNNTGGSFTGNFLDLQDIGVSRFNIDDTGQVNILIVDADNAIAINIDTEESSDSQTVFAITSDSAAGGADTIVTHFEADGTLFVSLNGTQTQNGVCHTTNSATVTNDQLVDCNGTPVDLAENFGTADPTIGPAELVAAIGEATEYVNPDGFRSSKAWVERTSQPYQQTLIGVVSTQPNQLYGDDIFTPEENPRPVSLAGRVPVKVNLENGVIQTGDFLTSSSVPGEAMKSTAAGMVIGQALSSYDGSAPNYSYVIVKIDPFYYDPTTVTYTLVDGMRLQQATETQALFAQTDGVAYLINQQGSGDLLQLQADGVDRLLVKNNGAVLVNTTNTQDTDTLISVKSAEADVFTLNARGDVTVAGNIIVTDSTYAGSIATNAQGLAEVQFTNHLGTGKPSVQITPEGEQVVIAQISHWMRDENQNYTGVVIKAANLDGTPASAIVHYLVTGKPAGYATQGQTIVVYSEPQPTPEVAGDTTTTTNTTDEPPVTDTATTDTTTTDTTTTDTQPTADQPVVETTPTDTSTTDTVVTDTTIPTDTTVTTEPAPAETPAPDTTVTITEPASEPNL